MNWDESWKVRRRKAAIEMSIAGAIAMAKRPSGVGATYAQIGDGYALYNGSWTQLNRVIQLGLTGPVNGQTVDEVERFYRKYEERVTISISTDSTHRSLVELLERRGYQRSPMCRTLLRPVRKEEQRSPSREIRISAVGADYAETWARLVAAGFRSHDTPLEQISPREVDIFHVLGFAENCYPFLATWCEELAGGGVVVIQDDMAFLRTASTRHQYRRRGVQAALINERLRLAASSGCKFAISAAGWGSQSEGNLTKSSFTFLSQGYDMYK
jgi:GNAT superfamily N-acetyltransferase